MISCIRANDKAGKFASISKVRPQKFIGKIGSYDIIKSLGKGADGDVVLVIDANYLIYAMKMSKIGKELSMSREIQTYQHLQKEEQHDHLIQMVESGENVLKTKSREERRLSMVLEYCPGRELFDHVSQKKFDESLGRYFFKQLINAVEFLHLNSIAHLDIKMENILLDS